MKYDNTISKWDFRISCFHAGNTIGKETPEFLFEKMRKPIAILLCSFKFIIIIIKFLTINRLNITKHNNNGINNIRMVKIIN